MPRRRNGAGVHTAANARADGRSATHHAVFRNRSMLTVHNGPGRPECTQRVLSRATKQGIEAFITDQRGLIDEEVQCGGAGFVGSAQKLEEDAQSGLFVVDASDRGGRFSQVECRWGGRKSDVRPEIGAGPLAPDDGLDRIGGISGYPANVTRREDAASARGADTPVLGRTLDGPQIHPSNIRALRSQVNSSPSAANLTKYTARAKTDPD